MIISMRDQLRTTVQSRVSFNPFGKFGRMSKFTRMATTGGLRIVPLALLVASTMPQAAYADPLEISIEPLVGYEQVQIVLPTPHTTTRLFYGATATVGVMMIAGEVQYTHATNTEIYPTLTQINTGDRLKVGARSGFKLGPLFTLFVRAGVEAAQEKFEQTSGGITTTTVNPVTYRPYAGAGARASLANKLFATANVTAVITDINNLALTEFQASAGFGVRLP